MTEKILRAVIYVRVSTAKQANEGYGLDTQEVRCRGLAQSKGWEVTEVYREEGISGTLDEKTGRVKLKKALEDADKKLYDVFIFYSLDRIGRTTAIVLSTIELLTKKQIKFASCKESIDTSCPSGVFVLTVFAGLAQLERDNIVERLAAGKKHRMEKIDGEGGGGLIWGYLRKDKKIIINEEAAKIINYIYHLYYEKHYYIKKIADELNKNKIPSPKKKSWYPNSVSNILKKNSKAYRGGRRGNSPYFWPKILEKEYVKEEEIEEREYESDENESDENESDENENESDENENDENKS